METYVYEEIATRIPKPLKYKCRQDGKFYQVLGESNTEILSLNNTSYEILKRCDGKTSINIIHQELINIYTGVDSLRLLKDIINTVINFEHLNLITFYRDFFNE